MMKVFGLLMILAPSAALASDATCMTAGEMDAALIDWHGETVTHESSDGAFALWQNARFETWTLVQYHVTGLACVVGFGTGAPFETKPTELLAELAK